MTGMRYVTKTITIAVLALTLTAGVFAPRQAVADTDPQKLVGQSGLAAQTLIKDENFPTLADWMKKAKGVMIVPSLIRGGIFIVGGAGGNGVIVGRNQDGSWGYPTFMTLGAASAGLQLGGEVSEMMFVIMTDKGLKAVLDSEFKFGAGASLALGPVGAGASGATTAGLGADIYAFSRNKGLFGGLMLEGAWIKSRQSLNEAYYGKGAKPDAIVLKGRHSNPGADKLRAILSAIKGKPATGAIEVKPLKKR